jgi:hypothetical protein
MNQAQSFIAALREASLGLLEEVADGVTIEITRVSNESILGFFSGKTDKLPIGVRVVFREDESQDEQLDK